MFDEIRNTKEKVWNDIDVAEARDKAKEFKTYQTHNFNGNITTEVTLDNQECREPSMTELELWFSSQDFRTEFDKVEDTICNNDIRTEIVFSIKVLPQGKGFRTLFDSDQESDNECTVMNTTVGHHSNDNGEELDAKITLIIGRKDNGKIDVLHSYLNGVKRRMFVDSGAAISVIHNTQYPKKSRLFRIESVEKNYLYDWYEPSDIFWSDEEGEHDDNDDKDGKNAITIDKQQEELK